MEAIEEEHKKEMLISRLNYTVILRIDCKYMYGWPLLRSNVVGHFPFCLRWRWNPNNWNWLVELLTFSSINYRPFITDCEYKIFLNQDNVKTMFEIFVEYHWWIPMKIIYFSMMFVIVATADVEANRWQTSSLCHTKTLQTFPISFHIDLFLIELTN